jgi:hypothetical protein
MSADWDRFIFGHPYQFFLLIRFKIFQYIYDTMKNLEFDSSHSTVFRSIQDLRRLVRIRIRILLFVSDFQNAYKK